MATSTVPVPVGTRFTLLLPEAAPTVILPEVAVTLVARAAPRVGVTRVGLLAKTKEPEPVSSEITPANSEEVVAANALSLSAT